MDPLDPSAPFSRAAALSAGLTWRTLKSQAYRRVAHDRHVKADIPDDHLMRCRAVRSTLGPGMVFSHHTAATLWGATVPVSANVHVAMQGQARMIREGFKLHRFTYPMATGWQHSLPVTTPEMTFGHMAREVDLVDLVSLGDSLVRASRTTPATLWHSAQTWPGQHRALLLKAASLVRSGVDSVQETRLRLLLTLAGLPEPQCGVAIARSDGSVQWRLDLAYREQHLAVEYDGAWHSAPDQLEYDRLRRAALEHRGWRVVVVTSRDLHERPGEVVLAVASALAAKGVVTRTSDSWRRHFRAPLRAA